MLFGATGWVGGMVKEILEERKLDTHCATSRIENRADVEKYMLCFSRLTRPAQTKPPCLLLRELDEFKPTHVINAAGLVVHALFCGFNCKHHCRYSTTNINLCCCVRRVGQTWTGAMCTKKTPHGNLHRHCIDTHLEQQPTFYMLFRVNVIGTLNLYDLCDQVQTSCLQPKASLQHQNVQPHDSGKSTLRTMLVAVCTDTMSR